MQATVNCKETPDGAEVVIEYEDGHTVRISAAPDSVVLQLHLGLDLTPGAHGA